MHTTDAKTLGRIGVELELLAPPGRTRLDLATALAGAHGGVTRPMLQFDSEPSLVPGTPVFENLTLGFEVHAAGDLVARCVDDLTLQADLDRQAAPREGWFRVVSDDRRMLHLVVRHGRLGGSLQDLVRPVAALFGVEPEVLPGGMVRVRDADGSPVCIAVPLPGERWRPCELVTPPLHADHLDRLEALVAPARAMGFGVAAESATHVHFDGAPLCDASVFRNLVYLWETWGPALKAYVGCNPRCVRLGDWPRELFEAVGAPGFERLSWRRAQEVLRPLALSKYVDLNLRNIVHDVATKHTVEVRVLPGMLEPADVLRAAEPFAALLRRAVEGPPVPRRGPAMSGRLPWSVIGWHPSGH